MEWKTVQIPSWIARFVPRRQLRQNTLERDRRHAAHRAYAAGAVNNLTFSWSGEEKTADQVVLEDLAMLRGRSREQVRNNPTARKFIKMVGDNVVGHQGIVMQAHIKNASGGRNKMSSSVLERHWKIWGMAGECEVTGGLSWVDVQVLVAKTWATDGEAIVRKVRGGTYGLQLQIIDPVLLDVNYNAELKSGNKIRMGIELNAWGRPVAYHLAEPKARAVYGYDYRKAFTRIPASEIIHVFNRELVGQSRGIPQMATALMRMNMLEGYNEAALVNAREGASNVTYFTSPDGGETMPADAVAADGSLLENVEPGSKRVLPPGYGLEPYDPNYPNGEIAEFSKLMLQEIASGLGVDYVGLSGNLEGVNYSSIRAGVLETREAWKGLQKFLIDHFCRPVYEAWLHEALSNQALVRPNGSAPLMLMDEMKYRDVVWQGRRWNWVDPLKDIQASKLAVEMGVTTVSAVIRETGRDPEEVWTEYESDKEQLEPLGVSMTGDGGTEVMEDEEDD